MGALEILFIIIVKLAEHFQTSSLSLCQSEVKTAVHTHGEDEIWLKFKTNVAHNAPALLMPGTCLHIVQEARPSASTPTQTTTTIPPPPTHPKKNTHIKNHWTTKNYKLITKTKLNNQPPKLQQQSPPSHIKNIVHHAHI